MPETPSEHFQLHNPDRSTQSYHPQRATPGFCDQGIAVANATVPRVNLGHSRAPRLSWSPWVDRGIDKGKFTSLPTPCFPRRTGIQDTHTDLALLGSREALAAVRHVRGQSAAITCTLRGPDEAIDCRAAFLLVLWEDHWAEGFIEHLTALENLSSRPMVIIAHRADQSPPKGVAGRPTLRWLTYAPIAACLEQIITALVIPMTYEGFICVDHEDLVPAITSGGCLSSFLCVGEDIINAGTDAIGAAAGDLRTLGRRAMVCASIYMAPDAFSIDQFHMFAEGIQDRLHEDVPMILSAVPHCGGPTFASIMAMTG